MQKQKFLAIGSMLMVAALLAVAGGNAVSAQGNATPAPTMAATASMASIPGTGLVKGKADGEATRLNASGATFPLPLYQKWATEYKNVTGVELNYAGGGSGQGKKDFSSSTVDYAGSDSLLNADELKAVKGGDFVYIASTVGAIVPVYNLPELKGKDPIKFTGDTLAQIYLGKITKWNDAALVADNPGLKDVNKPIEVVYRSDGSGTTNNFTIYLTAQSKDWAAGPKSGSTVKWPVGIGANGNPGVANQVKSDEGAIGYVELAFAKDLQNGQLKNNAGKFVTASAASITAAAQGIELPDTMDIVIIGKSTDENAWPISTFTWLLAYTKQTDAGKGLALTRFLWWATHDGQAFGADLGYAPLPAAAIAKDEANILKIQVNGKQALPTSIATAKPAAAATMAATMAATAAK